MIKEIMRRGFTDKLYFLNFVSVQLIVFSTIVLTAISGILGISDLTTLGVIAASAYTELGLHTAFIVWKAKTENFNKNISVEDPIDME